MYVVLLKMTDGVDFVRAASSSFRRLQSAKVFLLNVAGRAKTSEWRGAFSFVQSTVQLIVTALQFYHADGLSVTRSLCSCDLWPCRLAGTSWGIVDWRPQLEPSLTTLWVAGPLSNDLEINCTPSLSLDVQELQRSSCSLLS